MDNYEKICKICRGAPTKGKADACEKCLKELESYSAKGSPTVWKRNPKGKKLCVTDELLSILRHMRKTTKDGWISYEKLADYLKCSKNTVVTLIRRNRSKIETSGGKARLKSAAKEESLQNVIAHIIDAVPLKPEIERLLDDFDHR